MTHTAQRSIHAPPANHDAVQSKHSWYLIHVHVRPLVRTATAKHIHLTHFIGHDHAGAVTGRREEGREKGGGGGGCRDGSTKKGVCSERERMTE